MDRTVRLLLPDTPEEFDLLESITDRYATAPEPSETKRQSFYDTFDWRLYKKGLELCRENSSYHILAPDSSVPLTSVTCQRRGKPRFWWEFPAGPLREKLGSCLGARALLHLTTIQKRRRGVRILNGDHKTVLRVDLEEVQVAHRKGKTSLVRTVVLQPVRGYSEELRDFRRYLHDLNIRDAVEDPYLEALKVIGVTPGAYSSKLDFQLEPQMPARQAALQIFTHLLRTMKQNEKGIRADIDSEFLHDYRVALRRTRSALTQIKHIFPPEAIHGFKKDYARLGKLSNRLRDLDVYLLKKSEYRDMLPGQLRSGLDPLFRTLAAERQEAHAEFVQAMAMQDYRRVISRWDSFLDTAAVSGTAPGRHGEEPVLGLARRLIDKKYRQVVDAGLKITDDSCDAELHRLRIQCKKLRYLLEFFASLFPAKETTHLIKQLKQLQDNLGDFNDLRVQQENLTRYLRGVRGYGARTVLEASAVGGLMARLHARQQEVRQAFAHTFQLFCCPENKLLFRKLFGKTASKAEA